MRRKSTVPAWRRRAVWLLTAFLLTAGTAGCGKAGTEEEPDNRGDNTVQEETKGGAQAGNREETKDNGQTEESREESPEEAENKSSGNNMSDEEEKMMQEYGIEIFCPEEYSKKSEQGEYSELIKTQYYSTTCEKERNVNILLPVGYTEEKKYPVLYVLHGIFGTENDMTFNSVTIQNMTAKGAAEEMIVVYPYMYASKTKDVCTAIDKENVAAYDNFINDLVEDLMPYMKENYSVAEGKENTAIVGFSMGGRESLAIGLQRPDLFGYVGAIAPAPGLVPGKDWAMEHEGQFAEEELVFSEEAPFLLMICSGDSDKTVGQFPVSYHNIFVNNQVEHVWWEIPGSDHGDPAITSGIYNFCKNIFQ